MPRPGRKVAEISSAFLPMLDALRLKRTGSWPPGPGGTTSVGAGGLILVCSLWKFPCPRSYAAINSPRHSSPTILGVTQPLVVKLLPPCNGFRCPVFRALRLIVFRSPGLSIFATKPCCRSRAVCTSNSCHLTPQNPEIRVA
jgi:hypothetical protein